MIDKNSLENFWFRPTKHIFRDLGKYVLDRGRVDKHRVFIDRGSDILIVAHLDTIQKPKWNKLEGGILYAAGLDDRLGCFLAYQISEKLGLDLLLTDHEECGKTTGMSHTLKDYNWIAEFDRGGSDVVTYDLDCPEFIDALDEFFGVGYGTYSDIASLDTMACCVNIGIGYESDHSKDSYVDLSVTADQMDRFQKFYALHKDHKFVQTITEQGHGRFEDVNCWPRRRTKKDFWDECDICGSGNTQPIFGYLLCRQCVEYMMESDRMINSIRDMNYERD